MTGSYKYSHSDSRILLSKDLSKPGLEQPVYRSHRRELEMKFRLFFKV